MMLKLSTNGRLVIPAQIRKALNLKASDKVSAERQGQNLVLRRAYEGSATLKKGNFGRLVLVAAPGAPPMTTESVIALR